MAQRLKTAKGGMIPEIARKLIQYPGEETSRELMSCEDGLVWVDWKEEDEDIIRNTARAIGIRELKPEWVDDKLYVRLGKRQHYIPLKFRPDEQKITLRTVNEALAPDYELRLINASTHADTWAYLPLDADSWKALEAEYGEKKIAKTFKKIRFDAAAWENRARLKFKPIRRKTNPVPAETAETIPPPTPFAEKIALVEAASISSARGRVRVPGKGSKLAAPRATRETVSDIPILTKDGFKPVNKLAPGDMVVTRRSQAAGGIDWRRVGRVIRLRDKRMRQIQLRTAGDKLETLCLPRDYNLQVIKSDGIYGESVGFLRLGDKLEVHDGGYVVVEGFTDQEPTATIFILDCSQTTPYVPLAFHYTEFAVGSLGVWIRSTGPWMNDDGTIMR
jgi:hypothetical protein